MEKLSISALVVGRNESDLLKDCLKSIQFCEEIVYVDLESTDNWIEQVGNLATRVIKHSIVPIGEYIQEEYKDQLKNDWILIIDPDERVSVNLYNDIKRLFSQGIDDSIGGIYVPCLFYFKSHPLKGTPWGGSNYRLLIFNRNRYLISGQVHAGRSVLEPYKDYFLPYKDGNVDHHYWMMSYSQLIEKHKRYLKLEPTSRYNSGMRSSLKRVYYTPIREFRYAFFEKKGYKDGLIGIFLSFFWAWYQFKAEIGLYKHQKSIFSK